MPHRDSFLALAGDHMLSAKVQGLHNGCFGEIIESSRLEKTSKIIKSNCQPNNTTLAKPRPEVPHLHVF